VSESEIRSYHGQPVIKQPVWTWEIPTYFFTGGIAGASAGLAYLAELRGNDVLARRAWANALAGVTISPALLSSDLGVPIRFMNMLRMIKVTSPMSLGSWSLAASGSTTGLVVANQLAGVFPRASRLARPLAAVLGLPLSTYTAALIANTAVPVWHEARVELPFVFASGAALSAGAAAVATTPPAHAAPARRLALAGAALEIASKQVMEKRLTEHGEPYKRGVGPTLDRASQACIALGTGLMATRGRRSRAAARAAGTLLCAGALCARWSVFKAGFESAADPKYVIGPQRRRVGDGKLDAASRPPGTTPATERAAQPSAVS
jgi:hypothetical protein